MGVQAALPWRRAAIPRAMKQRLAASGGGRVLGWSWLPGEGWAVATPSALVVADAEHPDTHPLRIRWDHVLKASWTDGALELVGTAEGAPSRARYVLAVDEQGLLAEAVRTLVTGTIAWSQRIDEGPERRAWFAARRDESGAITWAVSFDAGLDASDPDLRAWADDRLATIREATGLD